MMQRSHAVATMVAVAFMWSIAGVVTRQLETARSFEITFWRSFFTAVSLVLMLSVWPGGASWNRTAWRSRTLWLSGLCWSVMFTAFMVALTLTSVANVLVTLAIGPLLTALMARAVIGYRLPPRTWIAIAVAGFGIAYMFGAEVSTSQLTGVLVALCVPLAGALNWTVTQRAQSQGQLADLVPAVLIGAVISSLTTLPLALPLHASSHDIGWLALLGLLQLAIPCALSVVCARVLKAPEVALLALLEVIFGITLAWLGAGEAPSRAVLTGGTLVVGALIANELAGWRRSV